MADQEKDNIPVLAKSNKLKRFSHKSSSMSISSPQTRDENPFESNPSFISHTGPLQLQRPPNPQFIQMSGPLRSFKKTEIFPPTIPSVSNQSNKIPQVNVMSEEIGRDDWSFHENIRKNEHLLKSGPLGLCNNPDCTDCPSAYKKSKRGIYTGSTIDSKLNYLYGDMVDGCEAKNSIKKSFINILSYIPIMNPHTKFVQQWNQFFVISCLVAIFVDPLFFFVLSVEKENKCTVLNWKFGTAIAVVRSITDMIYFLHMLLQFRLAYVAPESRVVGAGDLVDEPKKIARHYFKGYFIFDFFVVLPFPQVMILVVIPKYLGSSAANYAKNVLHSTILLQYAPRIVRFVPLLGGQSVSGFIFESAWVNFLINLLMFVLAGHVVGSSWYLFGLQRLNQCLKDTCAESSIENCHFMIDCGRGNYDNNFSKFRQEWIDYPNSTNCLDYTSNQFDYGIYNQAVLLTTKHSVVNRYIYSVFWGFQQISTLAGNLVPSYFVWEVLFTMAIVGLGLFLFALLIGNMQNFLQALGRRKLEMQLRRRDVEQWMGHRRLSEDLRKKVRQAERFSWAATRGVNEEELLSNLPEDIQREIRRHFFRFLNKVRIFTLLDEPILDAICEKLRQKLYIRGSDLVYYGGPVDKMVFIVRGKLESVGADGHVAPLQEGDVCGEELITWYLEQHSYREAGGKNKLQGLRYISTRTVKCLTNVEAFALHASDLEGVTHLFSRFLRKPRVQGAIRYESPYWRERAAIRIQVAWKYRKRRLRRSEAFTIAAAMSTNINTESISHPIDITNEEYVSSLSPNRAIVQDATETDPKTDPNLLHEANLDGTSKVPRGIRKKDGGKGHRRYKGILELRKNTNKGSSKSNVFEQSNFGQPLYSSGITFLRVSI